MRRGWKILIAALVLLVVVLGISAFVTSGETKSAEVRVPGGEILRLNGGDIQVLDKGPKDGAPIVLIHCFTCAIDWWDRMIPLMDRRHRVVAVDLLGHGGSEKPSSGYTIPNQANLVAQALDALGVSGATVVGHSLGGGVAVALAEQSPQLVDRIVIIDTRSSPDEEADLGFVAGLGFAPVIGESLWRFKPDFAVRDGLEVAFAPGFEVPDAFVEDVDQMTYTAYEESAQGFEDYTEEKSLADRVAATGKPLQVIMGAEEQIIDDPQAALDAYTEAVPDSFGNLIKGVGHSPNVEEPGLTADFVLGFALAEAKTPAAARKQPQKAGSKGRSKGKMQDGMQNREAVRGPS